MSVTYYKCVFVALGIQHAMRYIAVWLAVLYFSTLCHKRREFLKKNPEYDMYDMIFCTSFV
jgi:hypothetical protein